MKKRFLIGLLTVPSFFVSCNKEENSIINTQKESQPIVTDGVVAGRYHFSSIESLTKMMTTLGKNSHLLDRKIEELYQEGFRPKYPVGDIDNDPKLTSFYASRMPLGDDLDDGVAEEAEAENDLVSDPILSTFLNENNELVVRDTLYKFTKKGVFSSHLKDTLKLVSYLKSIEQEKISEEEVWRLRETEFGKRRMVEGVYRFIAPISELEKNNLEKEKKKAVSRTSEADLQLIINNLPQTEGDKNWFLHRITGQSIVAEAYFDRRHRVKVEFFNQDYGFYKSTGISVRNQTRRFRIWWASKANEIALGMNYIYVKYVMPTATMKELKAPGRPEDIMYVHNAQIRYYNTPVPLVKTNIDIREIPVPFIRIENREILNIHIPALIKPLVNNQDYQLYTDDILSKSNILKLYEMGANILGSEIRKGKEFVVTRIPWFEDTIEAVYFSERYHEENDANLKHYISKDWGFVASFGMSFGGAKGSEWKSAKYNLQAPDMKKVSAIKYDFYGMARVGGEWKGFRMVKQ
ncbi:MULTISPECIES: hypothetical protein [Capnocytophaga]|jgi:hypothetical protein|uniref:hypothetical protein n=1 Tax=Capnocytophaga TaxID=1016 RepID=UPI00020C62F2|nr:MULTISPECIES: hypothetical protein [Capnocytophaga]KHE69218.1 hypothetical protein HMPREF9074_08569 [Capnocytophaga sp. oral taxon 329 str. F0087]QGS18817.1 hypothetical protein FOC45_11265 [Capnocytophaga sp. FDAARGOS_737]